MKLFISGMDKSDRWSQIPLTSLPKLQLFFGLVSKNSKIYSDIFNSIKEDLFFDEL